MSVAEVKNLWYCLKKSCYWMVKFAKKIYIFLPIVSIIYYRDVCLFLCRYIDPDCEDYLQLLQSLRSGDCS